MANKTIRATAELFLSTKQAKQDAKAFVSDLKGKLQDIESAADKMTVFKDMVEYIAEVDKALTALKAKNKDAFGNIASGLDSNLKNVLEMLLGISNVDVNRLDLIKDRIEDIANSGKKTGHNDAFKEIAKDLNNLYRAAGHAGDVLNIDDFGGAGRFEEKLQLLIDKANEFGITFEGISDRIANIFGLDGAKNMSKFGQTVKAEIDKVTAEFDRLDEMRATISDLSKVKIKINGLDDIRNNLDDSVTSAEELVNTLVDLHNKVQDRDSYSSDVDYYQDYVKYIETAKKVKQLFATEKGMDFISKKGDSVYDIALDAEEAADNFAQDFKNQVLYALDIAEAGIKARVREIRQNALSALNVGEVSGGTAAVGNGVQNKNIEESLSLYDQLKDKLAEYIDLVAEINDPSTSKEHRRELMSMTADIQEEIIALGSLSEEAQDDFDDLLENVSNGDIDAEQGLKDLANLLKIEIPQGAYTTESAVTSTFKQITQSANEASDAVQNVMYHLGNLLNGKGRPRDTFGDMTDNLTTAVAGTKYEQYGFGVLGGGLFGVTDPNTITQEPGSRTFIQSIDLSKYNMYMANTEERATALMDFLSKLQKFSMKSAEPNYSGFDEQIKDVDINSLYEQFSLVFDQSELTKDKFNEFVSEMVSMLKQAGLSFDKQTGELGFTNLTSEIANSENISTRFMKMLGYQGVSVGGTSFDGLGQGSVIFDFDKVDIVGYFNTVKEAVEDYQKIINSVDGENWVGSTDQLKQYADNIDNIINKLIEYKNSGKLSDTSDVDETLNKLTQIRQNISDILSGKDVSGQSPFVTITTGSADAVKVLTQAENKAQSFLDLCNEIKSTNFYNMGNATDNVEIGKYLERLESARSELTALENQGLLTAKQLDAVNNAFSDAQNYLRTETSAYDDYYDSRYYGGSYDAYSSDVFAAENAAEEANKRAEEAENSLTVAHNTISKLREENVALRDEIAGLQEQIDTDASDDELSDIERENGALEDRLEILREIADTYGVNISQKDRNRYDELNTKEMEDGLTSKEEDRMYELSEKIDEADSNLLEFEETYDRIILKLSNGKKVEILPDDDGLKKLYKIADSYGSEYNGQDIQDVIFVRKQEGAIIEENNKSLREQVNLEKQKDASKIIETANALKKQKLSYDSLNDAIETCIAANKMLLGEKSETELSAQMLEAIDVIRSKFRFGTGDDWYRLVNGKLSAQDFIVKIKPEFDAEVLRQEKLDLEKQVSNYMTEAGLDPFDDKFNAIFDGINDGTFVTLDQCIEKFNELKNVVESAEYSENATNINSAEIVQIEALHEKLLDVKAAVDAKTQAFEEEYVTVDAAVQSEISSLQELINKLDEVVTKVALIESSLKNIGSNSVQLNVGDGKEQIAATLTDADITNELGNLEKLQSHIIEVKNAVLSKTKAFYDEGIVVGQVIGKEIAALKQLESIVNNIAPKINTLTEKFKLLQQHSGDVGGAPSVDENIDNPQDVFKAKVSAQKGVMSKYINDIGGVGYVTEDITKKLVYLRDSLENVKTPDGLKNIVEQFGKLKDEISVLKSAFEKTGLNDIRNAETKLLGSYNTLSGDQKKALEYDRATVIQQLEAYKAAVLSGQKVELDAIEATTRALLDKIEAYKKANKEAEKEANQTAAQQKKNAKFGDTALINAKAKHQTLTKLANGKQFENSKEIENALKAYNAKYNAVLDRINLLRGKDGPIDDTDKTAFKELTTECNNYAKALEKIINDTMKLKGERVNTEDHMLGADFDYNDIEARKAALIDFANEMGAVNVSTANFKNGFKDLVFEVKNGDGTITKMTATFTDARNEIVALAGDTKKATSFLGGLWNQYQGKLKSIFTYALASVSIYDVWRVIKQGVGYVKEIDTALTELKKVTDATEASYDRFLKTMSKTASKVGSTVSELTTMAADWARLGYSMEEAGKLAQSTAILLNVSEFSDATAASEALISTMQAFQYTANESQHVVDILNEVGNNYAVSSDGIATALQDSASALMEAGNNLEQSVALVAAANKVVQDPNSVGSALRTISLRLRGTSVEILEGLGEETDGAVESVSKLQEKLKALTGVDILTESGAYKDTYTILKDIAAVWKDMDSMDQAAALELMAGKNRANTLAAILNNIKDLEGAYESALDAEGKALP